MAERAYTETTTGILGVLLVTWTGLLNGDTGAPYKAPNYPDKTVQVTGTLSVGGSLSFQGSNDPTSPTNFGVLHRADGTAGDMAFASGEGVEPATPLENPLWVRPSVTAGDGSTSLTCRMLASTGSRR